MSVMGLIVRYLEAGAEERNQIFEEILEAPRVQGIVRRAAGRYCYTGTGLRRKERARWEETKRRMAQNAFWESLGKYDPWRGLREGKRPLLFRGSADSTLVGELNAGGAPSQGVCRWFQGKGFRLSDDARVRVREKDFRWEVWDDPTVYLVVRLGVELGVYRGVSFWSYVKLEARRGVRDGIQREWKIRDPDELLSRIIEDLPDDDLRPEERAVVARWRKGAGEESEEEAEEGSGESFDKGIGGGPRKRPLLRWKSTEERLLAMAREVIKEKVIECVREHLFPWVGQRQPYLLVFLYASDYPNEREAVEAECRRRGLIDPGAIQRWYDAYRKWKERFQREREAHWVWRGLSPEEQDRVRQSLRETVGDGRMTAERKRAWAEGQKILLDQDSRVLVHVADHALGGGCILCDLEGEFFRRCGAMLKKFTVQELFFEG